MRTRWAVVVAAGMATGVPAHAQTPARRLLAWELGVSLSAGVIYRMDGMPASLHKDGSEMLEHARALAGRMGTTLPADAALQGAEVDTLVALDYLQDPKEHALARYLLANDGSDSAALFELGALSHLAMMSMSPASAKGLAERLEAAAGPTKVPRAAWGGLVDALRSGKPREAVIDEMAAMLKAVAAACKG